MDSQAKTPSVACLQICVIGAFVLLAILSAVGCSKLQLGLEIADLSPSTSYMRSFDDVYARLFNKFDQPTDIFFLPASEEEPEPPGAGERLSRDSDLLHPDEFLRPSPSSPREEEGAPQSSGLQHQVAWWSADVHASLRLLYERLASRPSTSRLVAPLLSMLDDPVIGPKLRQGDKRVSKFQTSQVNARSLASKLSSALRCDAMRCSPRGPRVPALFSSFKKRFTAS